ncbi:phage tail protein [Sediminispirochaeta smaragdinae]|uniref:Tail Collar domain protein n=1 Tax=Sediminispirochaeta smaragdinae (strain DSM 11293 / JCM 15392 / SEBR 4228) TaxID=573413 RepID=E1RBU7_SEDSS|nr:tail fiber protein [Sediminispirochaeta smaragdinae]ADK79827.1 Tail Collar domain protein [Sediminispirochaeta smaragdinae DSM 11293]
MDGFIGQILLFAFNYEPRQWLPCEGQMLQIVDNEALFSLVGTQYGGDGRTTFALPDLKGKEPVPGMRYCICTEGVYPPRS